MKLWRHTKSLIEKTCEKQVFPKNNPFPFRFHKKYPRNSFGIVLTLTGILDEMDEKLEIKMPKTPFFESYLLMDP